MTAQLDVLQTFIESLENQGETLCVFSTWDSNCHTLSYVLFKLKPKLTIFICQIFNNKKSEQSTRLLQYIKVHLTM